MAPAGDNTSYELHVLRTSADGVEPALLLKAPGNKAEYLFNVPDGFSRLALEHKLTPSARLSCVLLTSLLPRSTGGFGGLFFRLKHDGHGQVQIIGPQGSSGIIHSLRHICRWQHPKVFVSECCDNGPRPVFKDEHIVIVPLLAGDHSTNCLCCLYASRETPLAGEPNKQPQALFEPDGSYDSASDCSESSSSNGDRTTAQHVHSTKDRDEGDSFERRVNVPNGCSPEWKDISGFSHEPSTDGMPCSRSHREGNGCGTKCILPRRRKRYKAVSHQPLLNLEEILFSRVRAELYKAGRSKLGRHSREFNCGSHSRLSASRNHHGICCSELCCNGALPLPNAVHPACCLVGLTSIACAEDNVKELTCMKGDVGDGSPTFFVSDNCPAEKKFEAFSHLQSSQCSALAVEVSPGSGTSQELALTKCDATPECETTHKSNFSSSSPVGAELMKTQLVHEVKPFDWCISNVHPVELPQLADDANPVYSTTPLGYVCAVATPEIGEHSKLETNEGKVLGYICYLRKLQKAVLIVDCHSVEFLESLRGHPVLGCLCQSSGISKNDARHVNGENHTLAAVIHLTPESVVLSSDYQQWMESVSVTAPHVLMKERSLDFGFRSSLTTLKKLNGIHQQIFPLPRNITSSLRCMEASLEFAKKEISIVDADLGMVLKFCEGDTTISSVDHFPSTSLLEQMNSRVKMFVPTPELSSAKVEVPKLGAESPVKMSPNIMAAAAIRRRLLERKGEDSSYALSIESQSMSDDSSVKVNALKSFRKQDDVPICGLFATCTDEGHQNTNLSLILDKQSGRVSKLQKLGSQLVSYEEQQTNSLTLPRDSGNEAFPRVQEHVSLCESGSEFQLIFLGTGSAEPSKKRGSSGILLQVRGSRGAMLLDAGEGVGGQLIRRFGEEEARTVISSLQCLWLSHKHGDHALGVLSVIQMRSAQTSPLVIIGPHKVEQWLSEVRDTLTASGCQAPQFTYIHCNKFSDPERSTQGQEHAMQLHELLESLQLQSMRTVRVFHCHDAYGLVLEGRRGWKVVYSGDTRPCRQLIEAGHSCTVLIHEATFEDSLIEQAKQKRHSTVFEAVQVGRSMRARHIILTHFSQRYPEMVAMNGDQNEKVSLAFDGMVVPSRLLGSLGKLLPLIQAAFHKVSDMSRIFPLTESGQQTTVGPVMPIPILPVIQEKPLDCFNSIQTNGSVAKTHIRWSSDSDDDQVERKSLDGCNTIRWSSDYEAEFEDQPSNCLEDTGHSDGLHPEPFMHHCRLYGVAESSGPSGGKHLRWINSSSDDD